MGKVDLLVKCCLKKIKSEYNIKGILVSEKIKFMLDDTKMIIDLKNNTLKRTNEELELFFEFNLLKCLVLDKINNIKFNLEINLIKLEKTKDYFYVKYKIENDEFEIMIKII